MIEHNFVITSFWGMYLSAAHSSSLQYGSLCFSLCSSNSHSRSDCMAGINQQYLVYSQVAGRYQCC